MKAKHEDIEGMIAVCEANLVENNRGKMSDADFSKKGFLVTRMTFDDAKKMIDDEKNWIALILKEGSQALGYLTACDITKTEETFQEKISRIKNLRGEKILYYKQIAKMPGAKNVGSQLLAKMLGEAKNRGYSQVLCKIVHQPFFNEASVSFHEKAGFLQIDSIKENDRVLGIYLKSL